MSSCSSRPSRDVEAELRRIFQISEDQIRSLIVRRDEDDAAAPVMNGAPARTPQRPPRRPRRCGSSARSKLRRSGPGGSVRAGRREAPAAAEAPATETTPVAEAENPPKRPPSLTPRTIVQRLSIGLVRKGEENGPQSRHPDWPPGQRPRAEVHAQRHRRHPVPPGRQPADVRARPVQNGQEKQADFFSIVAWRQSAEYAANYLGKGRLVAVEGRLQVREYVTQDGQKRRDTEVVVDNLKSLDRPKEGEEGGRAAAAATARAQGGQAAAAV